MVLSVLFSAGFRPSLSTADTGGARLSHRQGMALADDYAGPALTARAVLLYDADADRILYEKEAHTRLAPASLTKLATALVALGHLDLQQVITAGPEVNEVGPEDTRVGLVPGDRATVEQLLYGILLTSGNDAALALAAGTGGSVEQFVGWMNELAGSLGLQDTHFVNPHGMDAADHYSSAYDLMVLARAAMQNPIIAKAVATAKTSIADWNYVNTNELLGQYPDVDGVKTGTTDAAGQCLIASAARGGHRVFAVLLGSTDRYADARALLDFYYARYTWQPLGLPDNLFSALQRDAAGRARYLAPAGPEAAFMARWELPWLQASLMLKPDGSGGQARFTSAGFVVAELPLAVIAP